MGSRPEPTRLEFDRPDGARIFVEVHTPPVPAEDPPILVLDGIGCSGWAFRKIIPKLAQRRRVALVHHRGHGNSPNPPRPWRLSMHTLADDAADVAHRAGLDKALVVGFSMGFQVALELYRRHRPQVRGLISIAGPIGQPLSTFGGSDWAASAMPVVATASRIARGTLRRLWTGLLPSRLVRELSLRTSVDASRIDVADLEIYLRQMAEVSPDLFISMLEQAQAHCADDLLTDIRVPTLVIAGSRDGFVPPTALRRAAFEIPGGRWQLIEGATHALPAEYPLTITQAIEELADELATERPRLRA